MPSRVPPAVQRTSMPSGDACRARENNTYGGRPLALSPFPLDVVIDRQGVMRYINREYEADELRAVIEAALAE